MNYIKFKELKKVINYKPEFSVIINQEWFKKLMDHINTTDSYKDIEHYKKDESGEYIISDLLATNIVIHFKIEHFGIMFYENFATIRQKTSVYSMLENNIKSISKIDEKLKKDLNAIQYVYIVVNKESGLYKIGLSSNPKSRLKELQTANGHELIFISCNQHFNAKELEKSLHELYKNKNTSGEWFKISINDINNILKFIKKWDSDIVKQNIYLEDIKLNSILHDFCEHCGKKHSFFKNELELTNRVFCKTECKSLHRRTELHTNICKTCNSKFKTSIKEKEFCSNECSLLYHNYDLSTLTPIIIKSIPPQTYHRTCVICGKPIKLNFVKDDANNIKVITNNTCSPHCHQLLKNDNSIHIEQKACKFCKRVLHIPENYEYCSLECEYLATGDIRQYKTSELSTYMISKIKRLLPLNNDYKDLYNSKSLISGILNTGD